MTEKWTLPASDDLALWLFNGLNTFHNAETFSDRRYALYPIELDDIDYVPLQIVRQVRTFERESLSRLRDATDYAIKLWRPNFSLNIVIDLIGLVQELGSLDLARHISNLTHRWTLSRLGEQERVKLVSVLIHALITDHDFCFGGRLYPEFGRLIDHSPGLPAATLAPALQMLVLRSPDRWQQIIRDHQDLFKSEPDPEKSLFGPVFFEIERGLSRGYFHDLFTQGGRANLLVEESWLIRWFLLSRSHPGSTVTPLNVHPTPESFWIGFASRPEDKIEIKRDLMTGRVLSEIQRVLIHLAGNIVQFPAVQSVHPLSSLTPNSAQADDSEPLMTLLRSQLGSPAR